MEAEAESPSASTPLTPDVAVEPEIINGTHTTVDYSAIRGKVWIS